MPARFRTAFLIGVTLASLSGAMIVQGCTSFDSRPRAAAEDKAFLNWYEKLAQDAKADPQYKKIVFASDDEANEFIQWLHNAYNKKIAKQQLLAQINGRYPNHLYEANFIASRLPE